MLATPLNHKNRFNGFIDTMSTHAYSRCWLHLIWGTLKREGMFTPPQAAKVSRFLTDYSRKNGIYMKINFVNTEHVHALVDLPTNMTIESGVAEVCDYIAGQAEHHRSKTFTEEYQRFVTVYGLVWPEETVETVSDVGPSANPSLKRGVNENS